MDNRQRMVDTHRPGEKEEVVYLEGIWKTSFCLEVVAQCVVHCTSSHYA